MTMHRVVEQTARRHEVLKPKSGSVALRPNDWLPATRAEVDGQRSSIAMTMTWRRTEAG